MAEKYLKVIRDGVDSYIPDNQANRSFWAKQNARIGKGRSAAHELATILPATDEEVAFMTKPVADSLTAGATHIAAQISLADELKSLRAISDSQQALINKLLIGNVEDSEITEKKKPGPKPKTNTDGKDDEAKGAEQA